MRAARVNRLLGRTAQRRADGTPTSGARRAWVRLLAAADAGYPDAIDALWEAWLRDPRDDTWAQAAGWLPLADVLVAAVDPARDPGNRAALGAFCVDHGTVPDNAIECVAFYVLTGQHERYQAADPDGSLLANAYRAAPAPTREALRHSMVGSGDLNLVRAIADRPDLVLDDAEADYLTGQLAGAGDWPGLWRQVQAMPFGAAVRAAQRFSGWRPADDLGCAYLDRLAGAGPSVLAALPTVAVTRLDALWSFEVSFAADGTAIAVGFDKGTTVFELPGGATIAHHPGHHQAEVVLLDGGSIVHQAGRAEGYALVRRAPGGAPELLLPDAPGAEIARAPGGFVVEHFDRLHYGTGSGPVSPGVRPPIGGATAALDLVAADPVSGQLLFRVYDVDDNEDDVEDLVLIDAELRELARVRSDELASGTFCGPGRFLLWGWDHEERLELWERDGRNLVRIATADFDAVEDPLLVGGRVVVRGDDGLVWLDAATLAPVGPAPGLPGVVNEFDLVAASPDGSLVAIMVDHRIEVHDLGLSEVAALLARPLSQATPADLQTVVTAGNRQLAEPVRAVVDLLRAGLEYRFGEDVVLGSGTTRIRPDDIALGDR